MERIINSFFIEFEKKTGRLPLIVNKVNVTTVTPDLA